MEIEVLREIGSWVGGCVAIIYALNRTWRTLGRTRVEGHKDAAEINMLAELQKENATLRQRADQFADERNRAIEELGRLRGEAEHLRQQVQALLNQVDHLTKQVNQQIRRSNGHS